MPTKINASIKATISSILNSCESEWQALLKNVRWWNILFWSDAIETNEPELEWPIKKESIEFPGVWTAFNESLSKIQICWQLSLLVWWFFWNIKLTFSEDAFLCWTTIFVLYKLSKMKKNFFIAIAFSSLSIACNKTNQTFDGSAIGSNLISETTLSTESDVPTMKANSNPLISLRW